MGVWSYSAFLCRDAVAGTVQAPGSECALLLEAVQRRNQVLFRNAIGGDCRHWLVSS